MVAVQRRDHLAPALGPERDDLHAELAAQIGEPVEQLGRVDPLDDDRDPMAAVGDPAAGPLPPAEVRQGEDHAVARGEPCDDVLVAVRRASRGDRRCRQVRQAEALHQYRAYESNASCTARRSRSPAERRVDAARGGARSSPGARGLATLAPKPSGRQRRRRRAGQRSCGQRRRAGSRRRQRSDEVEAGVAGRGVGRHDSRQSRRRGTRVRRRSVRADHGGSARRDAAHLDARLRDRGDRRLLPHLHEALHRGDRVSTSMSHSTEISVSSTARTAGRRRAAMIRSARSISPPLASSPSDSALARW